MISIPSSINSISIGYIGAHADRMFRLSTKRAECIFCDILK